MFIINFSMSICFLQLNPTVIIRSNPLVIIIFTIRYFETFYYQINWHQVSIQSNRTPTSSLRQLLYALLLLIQVLDYISIFINIFSYVLHKNTFVSYWLCWSWLDNWILPSLFFLQHAPWAEYQIYQSTPLYLCIPLLRLWKYKKTALQGFDEKICEHLVCGTIFYLQFLLVDYFLY